MRIMIFNGCVYNLEKVTSVYVSKTDRPVTINDETHTITERHLILAFGEDGMDLKISPWFDDMEEEDAGKAEAWLLNAIALYMAGTVKPCEPLNLVEILDQMEEVFNS